MDTRLEHPPVQMTLSCPQSPGGMRLPLQCLMAGHWWVKEHSMQSRIIDEAVLIFCIAGEGWLSVANRRYTVKPGVLFFCPPGVDHGYGCDRSTGWEIWWTHMQGSHAADLCAAAGLSAANPVLQVENSATLTGGFRSLVSCLMESVDGVEYDAAGRLYSLLLLLIRETGLYGSGDLTRFAGWRCASLDELAWESGYSKYHFSRLFKKQTGRSPWAYVLERKIEKARELLLGSRLSVKEISSILGFPNPDYFAKLFIRFTGVRPSQYRG